MRVYLDSRDLIVLVERKSREATAHFEQALRQGSSHLVYSMYNITECCAPLVRGGQGTQVMRSMNRLEQLPHVYVAEARITMSELKEAAAAFLERREYSDIALPLVPRFDYVVSGFDDPPTKQYLQYSLAQVIYDLWNTDKSLLVCDHANAKRLRALRALDRSRKDYRRQGPNFRNTVARNLLLYGISFPEEMVQALSTWIYQDPTRCPAQRLEYEVYHKILRNLADGGEDSDIPDFSHISCVPYCDAITLDRRMRGYIAQVDRSIGTQFAERIRRNVDEVEALLPPTAA